MARIIKEEVADTTGKEAGLAIIGRLFLVAGIALALASMVIGIVVFIIFGALSEIIALLKKLCGIPCSTHISGTGKGTIFLCSECGSMTWADSLKCSRCGVEFDSEEPDPIVTTGTDGAKV